MNCASACNTDTTPTKPHRNSNTHRTKNNTTNVVIEQNSRKLLMMDILMSETCWAQEKWNKIASDIKLIFYSSTITMMHGPIIIRYHGRVHDVTEFRVHTQSWEPGQVLRTAQSPAVGWLMEGEGRRPGQFSWALRSLPENSLFGRPKYAATAAPHKANLT